MLRNITGMEGTAKNQAWFWRSVALPLLLALVAFGLVGASTGLASSSTPLRPATVSHQQADSAPAMVLFNVTRYVGWTGRNPAHNLNLMTYNPTTKVFGPAQVLTETTVLGSGPSLAYFNGNLYVAWQGTDHRLNIGRYNLADPAHLANKVTLREYSNEAPSIIAFRNRENRLYLSWRGMDGHLNIISSTDATHFDTKVTYGITVRTSPSLVDAGAFLYVFWEDVTASSHIVAGRYDPSQPSVLSTVVTTSTSQLPVGVTKAPTVGSDVVVAWRTASDAHILLGIFEGNSILRNPVTAAETTLYGPALSGSFLGWTGTDAAQSVNVTSVNI